MKLTLLQNVLKYLKLIYKRIGAFQHNIKSKYIQCMELGGNSVEKLSECYCSAIQQIQILRYFIFTFVLESVRKSLVMTPVNLTLFCNILAVHVSLSLKDMWSRVFCIHIESTFLEFPECILVPLFFMKLFLFKG